MWFDVIEFIPKPIAAVHAPDAVELGRIAELEGERDFDRRAPRPLAQMPEVLAVVEDPGQEGIGRIFLATSGETGPTPGSCTPLLSAHPSTRASPLNGFTTTTNSGRRLRPLPLPASNPA
jgi:hypothetical protein